MNPNHRDRKFDQDIGGAIGHELHHCLGHINTDYILFEKTYNNGPLSWHRTVVFDHAVFSKQLVKLRETLVEIHDRTNSLRLVISESPGEVIIHGALHDIRKQSVFLTHFVYHLEKMLIAAEVSGETFLTFKNLIASVQQYFDLLSYLEKNYRVLLVEKQVGSFFPSQAITQIVSDLTDKLDDKKISLSLINRSEFKLNGPHLLFENAIFSLVNFSIEMLEKSRAEKKHLEIKLRVVKNELYIAITDTEMVITEGIRKAILDPTVIQGYKGWSLEIASIIMYNYFNGNISLMSATKSTIFQIIFKRADEKPDHMGR